MRKDISMQILFNKTIPMPDYGRPRRSRPRPEPAGAQVAASSKNASSHGAQARDGSGGNRAPGSPVPVADRRGEVPPAGTRRRPPSGARRFVGSVAFTPTGRGNIRPLVRRARRARVSHPESRNRKEKVSTMAVYKRGRT